MPKDEVSIRPKFNDLGLPGRKSNVLVSIVLATHNEVSNLPALLDRIESSIEFEHEIIFADDISTDGTRDYIAEYAKNHTRCKYIFSENMNGTALARYKGIRIANGDFIVIMDADLQHPPEKLNEMITSLEAGFDFVTCSRYIEGGSTGNRDPFRGLISRVAALLAKLLLRSARILSDPLSNYIAFRSNLSVPNVSWKGFELPLAIIGSNPGITIKEIPFDFRERDRGESSVISQHTFVMTYIKELIIYKKINNKEIKFANLVGDGVDS